ncbi:unnamed protein product [Ceratitis capitata]|uniref:(Mediterranean fruit fly) hypothetical protein n=1 Tax=Ceratitis capitata TaxID=7213 RepID=A0A811UJU6_CERCA|nr:unnamed protein product [Ceratitis capitata]
MAAATQMLLLLLPSNESLSVFVPREQHFEEEPNGGLLEGKTEFTQLYNITNRLERQLRVPVSLTVASPSCLC